MVVFILNTASPWIIPERLTAPQHTRFILPPIHPDKIHRCAAWAVFFFMGNVPWKFHEPTGRDTDFSSTPLQNRGRNFVRSKRWPTYMSSTTSTYFYALTIRKQLPGNNFERSGRGQEPSRGHKFSILENSCPFGTASCWGVPAPNPAGTSTANWNLVIFLKILNCH